MKNSKRTKIKSTTEKPRLLVFKSLNHIYAQLIDDQENKILAAVSSLKVADNKKKKSELIGEKIAESAKKLNIKKVIFDRSRYKYNSRRISDLANAARKNGLEF